jgi:inner membrane protein
MDSLSQIALGSAVGEAVIGKYVGRKASLWGAIIGTLPDLDVMIPMGDAIRDFTYHRAASHSFFFMLLVSPILVWLILKIHPQTKIYKFRWYLLVILALLTHALLDSFTVYGTQIFLPFSNYPVGWSTIFVIDPLYTIPLLIGLSFLFFKKFDPKFAHKMNYLGIFISSLYLVWTIGVKQHVNSLTVESLKKQNIEFRDFLTGPAPFNTLLWRSIAVTDSGYVEGFYSLFDEDNLIEFNEYKSEESFLAPINDTWEVQRLKWFSKGFYKVTNKNGNIIMSDLRMGVEPLYFFSFIVGKETNDKIVPAEIKQVESETFSMEESLSILWERIWDENTKSTLAK